MCACVCVGWLGHVAMCACMRAYVCVVVRPCSLVPHAPLAPPPPPDPLQVLHLFQSPHTSLPSSPPAQQPPYPPPMPVPIHPAPAIPLLLPPPLTVSTLPK